MRGLVAKVCCGVLCPCAQPSSRLSLMTQVLHSWARRADSCCYSSPEILRHRVSSSNSLAAMSYHLGEERIGMRFLCSHGQSVYTIASLKTDPQHCTFSQQARQHLVPTVRPTEELIPTLVSALRTRWALTSERQEKLLYAHGPRF